MSVQTTNIRAILGGNGVAVVFPFGFYVQNAAQIGVIYTDPSGNTFNLQPGSYTLGLVSPVVPYTGSQGGFVSYAPGGAPIPAGSYLTVVRTLPLTQNVSIANGGAFYPSVVVNEFDSLTMMIQQVADSVSRSLQAPVTDPLGVTLTIPSVAARAGMVAAYDPAGNPTILPPVQGVATQASSVFLPPPTAGATGSTLARQLGWFMTPGANFGAVGDGAADDTAALQRAFDSAIVSHKVLFLDPGATYKVSSTLRINANLASTLGFKISGGGWGTIIDGRTIAAGPTILWTGGQVFGGVVEDFQVFGSNTGPVVQMGKADFSDQINAIEIHGLNIKNSNGTAAAIGLQVNGVYLGSIDTVTNCTGHGVSLQLRQSQFVRYYGSYSTADVGVSLQDGYVFSNKFDTLDLETVNRCVSISGANCVRNRFICCQLVWNNGTGPAIAAIDATAGNGNTFDAQCNFASPGIKALGAVGIYVEGAGIGTLWVGGLGISPASGDADLVLDSVAGNSRFAVLKRAGSTRWQLGANNAAEPGGNVGTDMLFEAFDDSGNLLSVPLKISRSTGRLSLKDATLAIGAGSPIMTASGDSAALKAAFAYWASCGLLPAGSA